MLRLLLALLALPLASRAETCRFVGTTSHDGHLAVRTDAAQSDGTTTVDVTVAFSVHVWGSEYRYLAEEITGWRGSELRSVAVNQRYLADDSVKRQQWDVFVRNGERLEASRVQAKYLVDFRQHHPGFAAHWAPSSFGQPWLSDYAGATPERRPDLDLPAASATTPLAFAFYRSRFLPQEGVGATLVLPSFKQNKTASLALGAAVAGEGWSRWSTPLRHPGLSNRPASLAAAWVSPEHYLLQLGLDVHTLWASGQAIIRTEGCQGVQIRPG